jgi:hypothetical protein
MLKIMMIINVFLWSLLASLYPTNKNKTKVESYENYESKIKIPEEYIFDEKWGRKEVKLPEYTLHGKLDFYLVGNKQIK